MPDFWEWIRIVYKIAYQAAPTLFSTAKVYIHVINPGNPVLFITPTDIDLGSQITGYLFDSIFSITNNGTSTLTGTISKTAEWINSILPENFNIAPSQSITVNIAGSFPEGGNNFQTEINITSNGGNQVVLLHGTGISAIGDNIWQQSVWVYPNPAKDEINIQLSTAINGKAILTIFDLMGNQRFETKVEVIEQQLQLNLRSIGLNPGIYLIALKDEKTMLTGRLIICK